MEFIDLLNFYVRFQYLEEKEQKEIIESLIRTHDECFKDSKIKINTKGDKIYGKRTRKIRKA